MTLRPDIWHHLKDYEVFPPEEVGYQLSSILETEDATPAAVLQPRMARLQQYEIPPPPFLWLIIGQQFGITSRTPLWKKWHIPAAACLLLVAAGWIIYRSSTAAPAPQKPPATSIQQPVASTAGRSIHRDPAPQKKNVSGITPAGADKADSTAITRPVRRPFSIEGQSIPVADNDLLAAFASFTYPDIPPYLTSPVDKPLRIYIDQYSNVYVSKNMLGMIKEMYQVRANGKPARKARRARRRLDDWKQKDIRHFDNNRETNPLDPLDLAEFIFK
jgi:hypothetical protein